MNRTLLLLSLSLCLPASAQLAPHADTSWLRAYAVPTPDDYIQTTVNFSTIGQEGRATSDPRLVSLLRTSFPQHQAFWKDHGRFIPTADLVQTFLGISGSALLDDNRFVTLDGCVPHDCTDRGMLWIDTASQPASLIFVATGLVLGDGNDPTHLWLFASRKLDFVHMPPAFFTSLDRWHRGNEAHGYPENILMVTFVRPSGEQIDLTYSFLEPHAQQNPGEPK